MANPLKPARYMRDARNPVRAEKKRTREVERCAAKLDVATRADKITALSNRLQELVEGKVQNG